MDGLAAVIAALAAFATGATGIIGALVTWRKAADEQTVRAARAVDERMERLERSVDRLRVRERTLIDYVYRLHRQILGLGGEPDPWPTQLDDPTPGGHP